MTWLFAAAILAATVYSIILMTNKAEQLKGEINTDGICTGKSVSALEAYQDYTIRADDQGLMNCFCSELMRQNLPEGLLFTFADVNATDTRRYCQDVKLIQMEGTIVIFGTAFLIVAVNELTLFLLDKVTDIQRHHTQQERQLDLMRMATIAHFSNIALIMLAVHLNIAGSGVEESPRQ